MPKSNEGVKAPLNPFYTAIPFIFKRTGEVRRCAKAPRFSRSLSLAATQRAKVCANAESLTCIDGETTYILSKRQTKIVLSNDTAIEEMVLQGWKVFPTEQHNADLVTDIYTQETF